MSRRKQKCIYRFILLIYILRAFVHSYTCLFCFVYTYRYASMSLTLRLKPIIHIWWRDKRKLRRYNIRFTVHIWPNSLYVYLCAIFNVLCEGESKCFWSDFFLTILDFEFHLSACPHLTNTVRKMSFSISLLQIQ